MRRCRRIETHLTSRRHRRNHRIRNRLTRNKVETRRVRTRPTRIHRHIPTTNRFRHRHIQRHRTNTRRRNTTRQIRELHPQHITPTNLRLRHRTNPRLTRTRIKHTLRRHRRERLLHERERSGRNCRRSRRHDPDDTCCRRRRHNSRDLRGRVHDETRSGDAVERNCGRSGEVRAGDDDARPGRTRRRCERRDGRDRCERIEGIICIEQATPHRFDRSSVGHRHRRHPQAGEDLRRHEHGAILGEKCSYSSSMGSRLRRSVEPPDVPRKLPEEARRRSVRGCKVRFVHDQR